MCKGSGAENEPTDPGKEVKMDAVDKFRKKKERTQTLIWVSIEMKQTVSIHIPWR